MGTRAIFAKITGVEDKAALREWLNRVEVMEGADWDLSCPFVIRSHWEIESRSYDPDQWFYYAAIQSDGSGCYQHLEEYDYTSPWHFVEDCMMEMPELFDKSFRLKDSQVALDTSYGITHYLTIWESYENAKELLREMTVPNNALR